jgi:hypothetical protein
VAISATLKYLRAYGVDGLVDAYAVHTYPWAETAARRRNQLEEDTLVECGIAPLGKPCWLTEWGLPASGAACLDDDAPRVARMRELLSDLQEFIREGRLNGVFYFSWNDSKFGIYRCGALSESGRLTLGFGTLN